MSYAVVGDRDAGLTPAQLAARYGLSVSGARPGMLTYARQLWARRHFIASFAHARLTATYTTARLGQVWQVLTPLLNAAVYYLVFGLLLTSTHGVENVIGFICVGVFVFAFTQQAVTTGSRAISGNLGLIRALHFPRACMPLATTLTQLQQMFFSMLALLVIAVASGESVRIQWLLVIPALVLQTLFNAGLAMIFARVASKVTDVSQVLPFVMRTWMYGSGVIYSIARFADRAPAAVGFLLKVNPMAVYIELIRYALLAKPELSSTPTTLWLLAIGWAIVISLGGFIYFWRAEETYGRG